MKLPEALSWSDLDASERRRALTRPGHSEAAQVSARVAEVIAAVRARGDEAVREYAERYDGVVPFEVPSQDIENALEQTPGEVRAAIEAAVANLSAFHKPPAPFAVDTLPGVSCERRWCPLDRAGLYVPGGSAPLVSTVLMVGVPARIAGVPDRILCTPPAKDGTVNPSVLAAAQLAGVHRVFAVGGAQAIAAMAFGTATVPKVDKIFGPGNPWVTEAKRQCAADALGADQDLPAGPSEILIIADGSANPMFVAADLLSQAEHGSDSPVVLVATKVGMIQAVHDELGRQVASLSRREIIEGALTQLVSIVARDLGEAFAISNAYAPEHLGLHIADAEAHARRHVRAAGSVLVGRLTPVAAGDYASGTNHVLPTGGWARCRGGLGVESFMRAIEFQRLSPEGVAHLAPTVETLASLEGLDAHVRAMALRREGAK